MDTENAARDTIRGASDGLLMALREVDARERMKRGVRPGDPQFPKLAREVRIAAETLLRLARDEEGTAADIARSAAAATLPTINETRGPRDLAPILDQWRAVERRLEAADPASAEAEQLMNEFQGLRAKYADALEEHRRRQ